MIAELVYTLGAVASIVCAVLLLRAFIAHRMRLLLWSACCFVGLALNNVLLLVDLYLVPDMDLLAIRTIPAVLGMAALVFGLVWDSDQEAS